jgi:hypothetical protein
LDAVEPVTDQNFEQVLASLLGFMGETVCVDIKARIGSLPGPALARTTGTLQRAPEIPPASDEHVFLVGETVGSWFVVRGNDFEGSFVAEIIDERGSRPELHIRQRGSLITVS